MKHIPSKKRHTLIAGLSIFAMFFGSGNLVFPLYLGKISEGSITSSILGLGVSGILLPLIGLLAILKHNGNAFSFFDRLGKVPGFLICAVLLSLLGPFGVIPRCLLVSFDSIPASDALTIPLWSFSLLFCLGCYFIVNNKIHLVDLIGKYLTPFLIISMGVIIGTSLLTSNSPEIIYKRIDLDQFFTGVNVGYQTMDLLAGFFFATSIYSYFISKSNTNRNTLDSIKRPLISLIIGMSLLGIMYAFMIMLGNMYAPALNGNEISKHLSQIAFISLGSSAGYTVCFAVIMACFTTAVALLELFVDFIYEKAFKEKISKRIILIVSLIITFSISFLNFTGVMSFLSPILNILYPALIVFAVIMLFVPAKKSS